MLQMKETTHPLHTGFAEDTAPDDAALMRGIAGGDEQAFRALMRRHLGHSVRLAQRILGGAGAAEDAAQEAFIRVWKHAGNFDDPAARGAKFTTWLHRIVVNICIDEKRKKRFDALDDVPEPMDAADNAERAMQRREQSKRVQQALQALPERQRTAFVLCFYEGRSNKEAADIMGLGIKAVESLLVRARRDLRTRLQGEKEE
jgi:RNA polymerase sigma-70 factor, ECF subfamily